MESRCIITFNGELLSIEDINAIADGSAQSELSDDMEFVKRIQKGAQFLDELLQKDGVIYGVTTGYGDSCSESIPADQIEDLPKHLYTFHGCGLGDYFNESETRAILAVRLNSLCQGFSGVRYALLEQLHRLLSMNILPVIPKEGSVGASGDLTPLSYIAAVVCGERDVIYQGKRVPTQEVFEQLSIEPLQLRPKEGLAIMNGTAVMTALAVIAYQRAEYLAALCCRITSLSSLALQGNAYHFDPALFAVKPHPGQVKVAARIHNDLNVGDAPSNSARLQDRYSIRCAPHVIGVLEDSLPWLRQFIEIELNSANDNPIIEPDTRRVLHGGHFYGGHIAFTMDCLKNAVANLSDLLDRQMAQLMDKNMNHGLPANLSGASSDRFSLNHGFKAVQIGVSAWAAEALKLTMPASVFSRSTECHNQDKVSMGTIAARDCLRVLQLSEQCASAMLIAACQAIQLRIRNSELAYDTLSDELQLTIKELENHIVFVEEDRALESDLRYCCTAIQQRKWSLYV